jgi:cytoskeletal protein RodZ
LNDDLQPLKNRLRWLNRSILALGILILLGLIVWAVVGLRQPAKGVTSTVIHPASSAANLLTRAASAAVASAPRPVMSTAQQERSAAAAIDALSAASAPTTVAAASQPVASSEATKATKATKAPEASSAAVATPAAAPPVAPAVVTSPESAPESGSESTAKSAVKPPQQHKAAAPVRKEEAQAGSRSAAAKSQRVGTVQVCRAAGWYVQLGAFGKQHSIDRLAQRLHRAGYTLVCVAPREVRGLHLFYVGPYRNAEAARAARAPLHKLTGTEGILRKLP